MDKKYKRSAALIVLKDEKGKILLQKRDMKAERFPGYWGFFGGQIEKGERPEEAAKREIKEELDLDLLDLKFFKRYVLKRGDDLEEEFVFIAPLLKSVDDLKKQQKEGLGMGLFAVNELINLKTPEFERPIYEELSEEKF